jgi:hypothetical protein
MIHTEGKYRVRRGDSLWKIARHTYGHGTAWRDIQEANRLRPGNPILVGQLLVLPPERHRYGHHHPAHGADSHTHSAAAGPPPLHAPPHPAASPAPHVTSPVAPPSGNGDASAYLLARPVLFPEFKSKLEHTVFEYPMPPGRITCQFTGELTVKKEGVITGGLTFTPQGIEVEYKREANGVLHDFFQKCTGTIEDGKAKISIAVGAVLRRGDEVMATTEVEPDPPSGVKYTYQGHEMEVLYRGFSIKGVLGFVMKYDVDPQTPAAEPAPAHAVNWRRVAGGALIVGAVVLIVADVVKDGATLGAGTVESPISFAAAARMFASGAVMFRAVAN